jgi:hypothetical protein
MKQKWYFHGIVFRWHVFQLGRLLKEANIVEDFRLDKPLQMACGDVVTAVCSHVKPGMGM